MANTYDGSMLRRWFIRMPFLVALALVVGVWVGSYWGGFTSAWRCNKTLALMILVDGRVDFEVLERSAGGWLFNYLPVGTLNWTDVDSRSRFHLLGFCLHTVKGGDFNVIFPLWFATLLLLGLNWFVWGKTRAKPVGRAFSVDVQVT